MEFNTRNPNEYAAAAANIGHDSDSNDISPHVKLTVLMFWHHEGLIDWRDPKYQKFYDDDIFQDDKLYKAAMNPRHMLAIKRLQTHYRTARDARQERSLPLSYLEAAQSAAAKRKKKRKRNRKKIKKKSAVDGTKLRPTELQTLYYNGLDVYSRYVMRDSGNVSVAVKDWWALVCSLNPTFWIHRFDYTQNLYDIIKTWPQNDATFRRWRNILEKYIQKNADPRKRASFLDSLLGEDP